MSLSFTDYEQNETGVFTEYKDVWRISRSANTMTVKIAQSTINYVHKLDKIGDVRLTVHEDS